MDFGARQNALKTKEWESKKVISKMDFGARQNALKTKEWEPKQYSLQNWGSKRRALSTLSILLQPWDG